MRPVTIIGGGLAGLTLGIVLRQENVPVTLWEAARYPRHKVCGEFISGRGQDILSARGLLPLFLSAGARDAVDACFFSPNRQSKILRLPQPALCLSRFVTDKLLSDEFLRLGGELKQGSRWKDDFRGEGVVRATGRQVQNSVRGWRWFGLKIHARNVPMAADLEVHFFPYGYIGLCRLRDAVNVCGLLRSRSGTPHLQQEWRSWLLGGNDSFLRSRFANAEFDQSSFSVVAGLGLEPRVAIPRDECCIGDALTMIAPVTGNGMSMAIEAAELSVAPLRDFSRGKIGWSDARKIISRNCARQFTSRLRWASVLQGAFFSKFTRSGVLFAASKWEDLWLRFFAKTR